jgi:hypothetical protein
MVQPAAFSTKHALLATPPKSLLPSFKRLQTLDIDNEPADNMANIDSGVHTSQDVALFLHHYDTTTCWDHKTIVFVSNMFFLLPSPTDYKQAHVTVCKDGQWEHRGWTRVVQLYDNTLPHLALLPIEPFDQQTHNIHFCQPKKLNWEQNPEQPG